MGHVGDAVNHLPAAMKASIVSTANIIIAENITTITANSNITERVKTHRNPSNKTLQGRLNAHIGQHAL